MKEQFKEWFEVVYRDNPDAVNEIVSIWQDMVDEGEATWDAKDIFTDFFSLHNELPDYAHLFAIDYKASDELIEHLDEVAERFGFQFEWTEKTLNDADVETVLSIALNKFKEHNVLAYSIQTLGDYYYFVFIPKSKKHRKDFERVSANWNLECYQMFVEIRFAPINPTVCWE